MQPSSEYLAAPEVTRSREEAAHGQYCVVVENYATKAEPRGVCKVYLSVNGGASSEAVGWAVSVFDRVKLAATGRSWPPDEGRLKGLDEDGIKVNYIDHLDASDARVFTATFSFQSRQWKV